VDAHVVDGKVIHEALTIDAVRANHKDGEKFYWQLVGNAILLNVDKAELIVGCPYESELLEIKELAETWNGEINLYWLFMADKTELPYLLDGGYYKNLNIISFDVKQEDKDLLTSRVVECVKLLDA
jgi:hypothetical protein